MIDIRFSEGVFSLLTDPNSLRINSLTYVWTSWVKIFVILSSFGINLGPCKSDLYQFYFFMLSMNPKLLIAVSKIGTVSINAFAKNLDCPLSHILKLRARLEKFNYIESIILIYILILL